MAKARENSPVEAPRPERWSAQQKSEVVLRLLRGEDLGAVSRETQVPAHELEEWRRVHGFEASQRPQAGMLSQQPLQDRRSGALEPDDEHR